MVFGQSTQSTGYQQSQQDDANHNDVNKNNSGSNPNVSIGSNIAVVVMKKRMMQRRKTRHEDLGKLVHLQTQIDEVMILLWLRFLDLNIETAGPSKNNERTEIC